MQVRLTDKLHMNAANYRFKAIVLFIYVLLLGVAVARHEPWFDEAQAWLLARDASFFDLFFKYARYEGSPVLWHLILSIPAKLGLPYYTMNIIAGSIAAVATWLFIQYSPFPMLVKVLYSFSFFAFYQYAVVARSYVLLPLLLFLTAVTYKNRLHSPYAFFTCIFLLANVSLHGFLIAASLYLIQLFDVVKAWDDLQIKEQSRQAFSLAITGIGAALVMLQLKPPSDIITFASFKIELKYFFPKGITMLSDSLCTNISAAADRKTLFDSVTRILFYITVTVTPVWLLIKKRFMTLAVPVAGLCALFAVIYSNVWHQGTLFFIWLFALWITYEKEDRGSWAAAWAGKAMTAVLVLVLAVQVYWSASSFIYDFRYDYSASRSIAGYIKSNDMENSKIYITGFHSVSILPYFKQNIFCNYNNRQSPSFWLWSNKNAMYSEPYLYLAKYIPDFIVMGVKSYCKERIVLDRSMLPAVSGYEVDRYFDGALFWKDRPYETDSYALFKKTGDFQVQN